MSILAFTFMNVVCLMIDSEIQFPDTPFDLKESLVFLAKRGSESHGTYIPSDDPNSIDDRDLMGVCVPPRKYYLGLSHWEGADSFKGIWDVVLYEYKKFVNLLMKQNPNVIGMLWLEPEDYLFVSNEAQILIDNRKLFRHKQMAYDSFMGYANSQLKKMQGGAFKGYMGDKRKKLVEKFGFDTKNGAHLVRLLHMGKEYLETGELKVRRTWDRDMLISVKRGEWSLEKVKTYSNDYFVKFREAYKNSPLPDEIDKERINEILVSQISQKFGVNNGL